MATVDELLKSQAASQNATNNTNINQVPNSTEGEKRINAMFDAQKDAQLAGLKTAYDKNMSLAQDAKDKIAPQYQTVANDLAVQHERNRQNYNQQAAASGINTGAASQAALAQNSAYQRDYGKLRTSESEALTSADKSMADLAAEYENNAKAAVADNDYKRMAALLDQYNTDQQRSLAEAELRASFGDFSGFATLYGQQAADSMKNNWIIENPQLAYQLGAITQQQFMNLKAGLPMNGLGLGGMTGTMGGSDPWDYGGSGWNPSGSQAFANAAASVAHGTQTKQDIVNSYNSGNSGLTYSDLQFILNND